MKRIAALILCVLMLMTVACAEAADTTATDTPLSDESVREALTVLDNEDYSAAWEALSGGESIVSGTKSDAAKALQLALKALGYELYIDGNAGAKTFAALNELRASLGEDETDTVDAACFGRLMLWLRVKDDADNAEVLLDDAGLDAGEAKYWLACVKLAAGHGYAAAQLFTESEWGDYADRAAACAQELPASGEIYRAEDMTGREVQLVLNVKNQSSGEATLVKIYHEGECVSMVFIGEDGHASIRLSAGNYSVHQGTGEAWYGTQDAFGEAGRYEVMLFDGNSQVVTLETGRKYTLTLNDDGDTNVGSAVSDLSNF